MKPPPGPLPFHMHGDAPPFHAAHDTAVAVAAKPVVAVAADDTAVAVHHPANPGRAALPDELIDRFCIQSIILDGLNIVSSKLRWCWQCYSFSWFSSGSSCSNPDCKKFGFNVVKQHLLERPDEDVCRHMQKLRAFFMWEGATKESLDLAQSRLPFVFTVEPGADRVPASQRTDHKHGLGGKAKFPQHAPFTIAAPTGPPGRKSVRDAPPGPTGPGPTGHPVAPKAAAKAPAKAKAKAPAKAKAQAKAKTPATAKAKAAAKHVAKAIVLLVS